MCNGSVGAKGAPRVVDRLGIGSVAIGIESFADVVARHVYVDKTLVIRDFIDRGGVTLFCRPRRFGKSLMLRTLQCYFEAPVEGFVDDAGPLFDGLAIMGAEERHVAERGAHPVILVDGGHSQWGTPFVMQIANDPELNQSEFAKEYKKRMTQACAFNRVV